MFAVLREFKALVAQIENKENVELALEQIALTEGIPLSTYESYRVKKLVRPHAKAGNFYAEAIQRTIKGLKRKKERLEEENMRTPIVPSRGLRFAAPPSGRVYPVHRVSGVQGEEDETPMRPMEAEKAVRIAGVRRLTDLFPEEKQESTFEDYLATLGKGFTLKIKFSPPLE